MKVIFNSERASLGAGLHYGEIKIRLFTKVPLETDEDGEHLYEVFGDVKDAIEGYLIGLPIGAEDFIAYIEE